MANKPDVEVSQQFRDLLAATAKQAITGYKSRYGPRNLNPVAFDMLGKATEDWRRGRNMEARSTKFFRVRGVPRTVRRAEIIYDCATTKPYTVFILHAYTPSDVVVTESVVAFDLRHGHPFYTEREYHQEFSSTDPSKRTPRSSKPAIEVTVGRNDENGGVRTDDYAQIRIAWDEDTKQVVIFGHSLSRSGIVPDVTNSPLTYRKTVIDFAKMRAAIIDDVKRHTL